MNLITLKNLSDLSKLKLAVVGHVEWMTFLEVDAIPKPGIISHSKICLEEPAGGGALAAVRISNLIKNQVHFFTSLGKDSIGKKSYQRLQELGLKLHVAWREEPTRKGISFVDIKGERAITVIGKRLQPLGKDLLPWDSLCEFDAVFVTAADSQAIKLCRKADLLVATPRVGIKILNQANVQLDLLVGSGLDPAENLNPNELSLKPKLIISTEGAKGGEVLPGGRYKSIKLNSKVIDSYGCGDNFAAGVITGMAAKWNNEKAISLGASCGAECATYFGPYPKKL